MAAPYTEFSRDPITSRVIDPRKATGEDAGNDGNPPPEPRKELECLP